ncbi:MAG: substrate-binding domain-containing protein [Actinomycetota bacterium]|nr:substrate-binding domain-containing protein [Actinomycetota bacterium]
MDITGDREIDRRDFLRYGGLAAGAVVSGGLVGTWRDSSSRSAKQGTSGPGANSRRLPGQGKIIGLAVNGDVPYTQYVATGVKEGLKGTAYQLRITQANFDVETQVTNIEDMISIGVDGLVILAVDDAAANEGAARAAARGIAVGDTLWPGTAYPGQKAADRNYVVAADVDSYRGGQLIGNWLKAHAKPGEMVVVEGILGQGFSGVINKGLEHALAGTKFKIVVREQGDFSRATAISIVESALAAHPDVTTIVDYAAAMGDGIASFLQSKGIKHITHVTSDGDLEMMHKWLGTPYLAADRYYSAAETGLVATLGVREKIETGHKGPFIRPIFQAMATKQNIGKIFAAHPFVYQQYLRQVAAL